MNSRNAAKKDFYNILINNRILPRTVNNRQNQKTLDYSTTSTSNKINRNFNYSNLNSNNYYQIKSDVTNKENEESIRHFEKYSHYYFMNKDKDQKTELTLLNNGINSVLNKSNSNHHIKLSPLKLKKKFDKFEENLISKRLKINNSLLGKNNSDIWDKLKNSKSMIEAYKLRRANIRESFNKYEIYEKQREIDKLKINSNIKLSHINKLRKLYKIEQRSLINIENNIKKSFEKIDNVYSKNNETATNIIFMTGVNENEGNSKLIINKKKLKDDINKLESKISILKSEKSEILKWLFLLIKIKENKNILPDYYIDIIDKNISYSSLIKQNNGLSLSKSEYENIKSYKKNLIYNDAEEFFEQMVQMDKKIITVLNDKNYTLSKKNKAINENIKLKLDESLNNITLNINDEDLKKELNELKEENKKLKIAYTERKKYNKRKIKKNNSKLYITIVKLFEEFKKTNFNVIDFSINIYEKEEKIIMDILEFFEMNLNYLLNEKNNYNSKEDLKEKYKEAENKVKKESIYLKFLKQYQLLKKLAEEKNEKIRKRMEFPSFLPYKKVDFQYYLKNKKKVKNKNNKKEEGKDEIYKQYLLFS